MKRHKYYFKKKIKNLLKLNYKHFILLYIRNCSLTPLSTKQKTFNILIKNKKITFSQLKQFCLYTGRLRFILRNTKISRISFKELASNASIIGIIKLS